MKRTNLIAVLVVASSAALLADEKWDIVTLSPFPVDSVETSEWQTESLESLYQTGGGFAAAGREDEQPVSQEPTLGANAFRLEHASWGFGVSELRADFNLGEYCTDFPEGEIDWAKTAEAILASKEYSDGYLFYVDSATNDEKRVLFTRGGDVTVPWVLVGDVDASQVYTVGHTTWERPYRIFWSEYPFSGPRIDLSAHPDVRLLGDPAIVTPVYEANATSGQTGVSNLVKGVVFDAQSKTLRNYCRVIDEEKREYDGPEGQFVLAYYDSGAKDNLVATIVVEASCPDVAVIQANVGGELRPLGGGYDIAGLESEVKKGLTAIPGDDASPYLYKHSGRTNWSPKHEAIFAITPTDATTTKTGSSAPWRADVYWKAPDHMDVLWPFENDWYEISWPQDAPAFVVSGDATAPGLPIFTPTNYTTSVCDYQSPANIASVDNNSVSATSAGWFTIKMLAEDNVWFQPVKSVLRTDPEYATTNAAKWEIGSEVSLIGGAAAGGAQMAAQTADSALPGYIYEPSALGRRNWNPILYHEPKQDSITDAIDDGSDDDPYAKLKSSIYLVNTSESPLEVWWSRSVQQTDMAGPMRIPCVAQHYMAVWPEDKDVQTIVIASQKGSDGYIAGASPASLYLNSQSDTAWLDASAKIDPGLRGGFTFGFWLNSSPVEADRPATEPGLLATLFAKHLNGGVSFRLCDGSSDDKSQVLLSTTEDAGREWSDLASVEIPKDEWTYFALVFDPATNGTERTARLYAGAEVAWSGAIDLESVTNNMSLSIGAWAPLIGGTLLSGAAGVAIDAVSAWSLALTGEQIAEIWQRVGGSAEADICLLCRFTFDGPSDIVQLPGSPTRVATDTVALKAMLTLGALKMSPGAPELSSGIVRSDDGVKAEVYYENDSDKTGFNPNDEHAFLADAPDGKVVHALRCDLASEEGSQPLVLVQYAKEGKGAMRVFGVALTNDVYSTLGCTRKAGLMLTPPHPLDILDFANNENSFAITVSGTSTNSFGEATTDKEVVYYDRHSRMWARRDGSTDAYYYYATREGFWFPGRSSQPAVGTFVPWLARVDDERADLLTSAPLPWNWTITWPDDSEIPRMRVAQTLTTADAGLPEVWNASSMAVVFPVPEAGKLTRERVVHLIDPTVVQSQALPISTSFTDDYDFTLGPSGTTQLRKGKYYFPGVPPSISDRFYVDAANQKMCLVGQYVEKNAGGSYLQLNVLTPSERQALLALCKKPSNTPAWTNWTSAVNALALSEVAPNTTTRVAEKAVAGTQAGSSFRIKTTYKAVDHYALVASGEGTGYVTLIENDSPDTSMVDEGSTISMHVVKVEPELYAGGLTVITDPLNKLSEQLTIAYTSPFGAAADDFEFEWRRIETQADGSVPTDYADWRLYGASAQAGRTSILLGAAGADLKDLQNMYYVMRYRAAPGTTARAVTGETWSDWCGPTLAEGWVQRVLNAVTPFAQRCADFSNYTSDIGYSMLEQIGRPYHGDVALNNDNLNNIGLLELYRTVLNKAESMSLALGAKTDAGVNKQLLLAASRIAELYGILGDEAYSDAKNPTIGKNFVGNSSVFCFQNQLPSLLDEELALLRGRTSAVAPNMTTYPYYNRLIWNFTKGITEGEVAYVQNYLVYGTDGEITQEQAAAQYPQGHGDAYGHYLSMLKSFYHLSRNPYFDWYASMMEMLIGDSIVNVDYFDEEKFAEAAGKLAKTAMDTMDLTARKAWKDADGVVGAGYFDADQTQAFGYGEWATRGGYGAICNWAVVNSLLPTNGTPVDPLFDDKGVKRINRSTASSLAYLPAAVQGIERKLAALDAGMNPLGLSDNSIPFDIDPGSTPHFEQILSRAEKALANAQTVLDNANKFGSRLAQIAEAEASAAERQEKTEADYRKNLIAIYGTPLEGDIGPGGTYAQGYDGPDIYHYTYIDLGPYGLSALDKDLSKTLVAIKLKDDGPVDTVAKLNYDTDSSKTVTISYTLTPDGIPQAKSNMGARRTEGSIQTAYRSFIAAYQKAKSACAAYDKARAVLDVQRDIAKQKLGIAAADLAFDEIINAWTVSKTVVDFGADRAIDAATLIAKGVTNITEVGFKSTPKIIGAGLTVNTDPQAIVGGIVEGMRSVTAGAAESAIFAAKFTKANMAFTDKLLKLGIDIVLDGFDFYNAEVSSWERLKSAVDAVGSAAGSVRDAYASLVSAEQAYRAQIAKGDQLLEELAMVRRQWANGATATRYADMYNRVQRNSALTKYNVAYDAAQRYVFQLAKVYDYETGLLSSDPLAGDSFMREVIASRSIGEKGMTTDAGGTLWDAVTRMSANWNVLKPRLGVNNPETTTKWFSLRYSLFRIRPGEEGDAAWRDALMSCWRDNLWADPEIARYCQPPQNDSAPLSAEPGLVIAFPTAINLAENFFGRPLLGGETTYSSSDYAVKIAGVGLKFDGYDNLALKMSDGLAVEPNVYLVPVGLDYMRTPAGTSRKTLSFRVVDEVVPVPYEDIASAVSGDDWVAAIASCNDAAVIRRHSTMPVQGSGTSSTRLVGRSVWNDRWLLVIPASSLSSDRVTALKTFINGLDTDKDGMVDVPGVSDIEIGIKAYSRNGN
ncbi:MAG: LamG domain-containing protein [Kiritimatiellae bacterium]|nr:LamG domain-containing protein [Kiritimatiellia bacterium]